MPFESQRLIVVVGPSGAGKDSILSAWLSAQPAPLRPQRARRSITRPTDPHEDHEPITAEAFEAVRAAGGFAVHWQAHGLHYGVRRQELLPLNHGRWVVMNGSRAHLGQLRQLAPQARVVLIDAPAELRQQRLLARGREAAAARQQRVQREAEVGAVDLCIHNHGALDEAVAQLQRWWSGLQHARVLA